MSYIGGEMDVSKVRDGVVELFKMYPELYKEYKSGGIFLKFNGDIGCYLSKGNCKVHKLPDAFNDCIGEYGNGAISLDNIVEFDETILRSIAIYQKSYSDDIEGYSYYIGLSEKIGFNLRDFVPLANARSWSSPAELPDRVKSFIDKLYDNGVLLVVSRLHMVEDEPVISISSNQVGNCDYGFADLLLSWTKKTPIKDVYIVGIDSVNSYVMKKHSDGEYTITMF